jgi:hypothetical protein
MLRPACGVSATQQRAEEMRKRELPKLDEDAKYGFVVLFGKCHLSGAALKDRYRNSQ